MTRGIHRSLAAVGIGALALVLSACATGTLVDPGSDDEGAGNTEQVMIEAAWLDGGRMIGIVTEGSSTCVPTVGTAEVERDGVLAVTFDEPDAASPCTMDYVPRVSLVELPDGVDPSKDLAISVVGAGFDGSVDLAGVEGLTLDGPSDMTPSAGWTDIDGTFIVLLWGSSTCKEYVTSAEVTGPAAVTASLSGIPADKACTADMAPNPVLAEAHGLDGVPDVELTLTSTTADPVVIPILGVNDPKIPVG